MPNKLIYSLVGLIAMLFSQTSTLSDIAVVPQPTDVPSIVSLPEPFVSPTTESRPAPLAVVATSVPASSASKTRTVNGVQESRIVVMTEAARKNIQKIYTRGQLAGRNPRAFSKVGDSTMVWPPFMAVFDDRTTFKLGPFVYLQPAIDFYAGSFGRSSIAARKSMHTWTEFDPTWVEQGVCQRGEGPLLCELRLNNPSVAVIRLGANDVSAPKLFEENLRRIVDYCLAKGVIPVLGTKPDRLDGVENTLNKTVRRLADAYSVPLWDYDLVAGTVPGRGLEKDNVHIRGIGSHDYSSAKAFASGDSLQDLTSLMVLDAVRREVSTLKER